MRRIRSSVDANLSNSRTGGCMVNLKFQSIFGSIFRRLVVLRPPTKEIKSSVSGQLVSPKLMQVYHKRFVFFLLSSMCACSMIYIVIYFNAVNTTVTEFTSLEAYSIIL